MLTPHAFECEVGGRQLIIETGRIAGQAEAAVTVRYGDTEVLVTVCISDEPREGVDFLPLTVDYEERLYAAGKIPGGFIRREGRPTQEATLACRMTDRPLRPLLPKEWRRDIQLVITVLSADLENDADLLSIIGSSTVLSMSRVPFAGPVSSVCVGYLDGELILNPTLSQLEESDLDLVVASTKDCVVMVEAGANEVPEDIILKAIMMGHEANQDIIKLQEQIQQALGKPKIEVTSKEVPVELNEKVSNIIGTRLEQALSNTIKAERDEAVSEISKELVEKLEEYEKSDILDVFDKKIKAEIRKSILDKGQRISGRGLTEVRELDCQVGLLPRTHGSGLFTRGQTQVMTITTLGSTRKEQQLDGLGIEETKRFIHHYNFPPFSTGEARRIGTPSRREIGHGALAERSLLAVLPKDEDFPYTIRLVSEVMSSSGSTSMASVCASSLSLMDAGIPIKRAVAGIAMGLVTDESGNYAVLTDIEGTEDNYGDMDFKVAGTSEGITGLQMDTKIKGLSSEIVEKTFQQAKEARLHILGIMNNTISESRSELSLYAPRVYKLSIPTEKIGSVIGPGGKTIRSIIDETKTTIDIDDTGTVLIGSNDEAAARKAIEIIENMTREVEVGNVYTGKVTRILNFGAMVEILPGKEGLVHISELADYRVNSVEDVVKVDDEIMVKAIEIDNLGRVNLSRRAVLEESTGNSGSKDGGSGSVDYPFRSQRNSRPPQRSQNFRNKRR
ncbi:MAG: polyribonucleotide nucleotidyltransferase [Dehalococcoidales bacterium]|nr:MAG: polyribonucleotide nucleotidyltransferase [Dehalococcoidales bacterium]